MAMAIMFFFFCEWQSYSVLLNIYELN